MERTCQPGPQQISKWSLYKGHTHAHFLHAHLQRAGLRASTQHPPGMGGSKTQPRLAPLRPHSTHSTHCIAQGPPRVPSSPGTGTQAAGSLSHLTAVIIVGSSTAHCRQQLIAQHTPLSTACRHQCTACMAPQSAFRHGRACTREREQRTASSRSALSHAHAHVCRGAWSACRRTSKPRRASAPNQAPHTHAV